MRTDASRAAAHSASGALAGLVGTAVMMAMRLFDQRYRPRTMPPMRRDPGAYALHRAERALGIEANTPQTVDHIGAMLVHVGYGTMAGVAYSALRARTRTPALLLGALFGATLYTAGYAGWLPLMNFTSPPWKQRPLQIAGETFRHVAFGVTTAAVHAALTRTR